MTGGDRVGLAGIIPKPAWGGAHPQLRVAAIPPAGFGARADAPDCLPSSALERRLPVAEDVDVEPVGGEEVSGLVPGLVGDAVLPDDRLGVARSEEHTSELQSPK